MTIFKKYERIIDTDLYTMREQIVIVMNVLAVKEPRQSVLNKQGKEKLVVCWWRMSVSIMGICCILHIMSEHTIMTL